jgi:hypothetical protein
MFKITILSQRDNSILKAIIAYRSTREGFDERANGLPFSRRERATEGVKKERSRARSGRLERRVGRLGTLWRFVVEIVERATATAQLEGSAHRTA